MKIEKADPSTLFKNLELKGFDKNEAIDIGEVNFAQNARERNVLNIQSLVKRQINNRGKKPYHIYFKSSNSLF